MEQVIDLTEGWLYSTAGVFLAWGVGPPGEETSELARLRELQAPTGYSALPCYRTTWASLSRLWEAGAGPFIPAALPALIP